MLRTTNKQVKLDLTSHVLEPFWPKNYGSGTVGLQNLVEQIDSMRYGDRTIYQTALDYVEGGSLFIYYGDARDFLQKILQETNEEAARFSDDKVWRLYCHLCARTIAQLYEARQLELERLKTYKLYHDSELVLEVGHMQGIYNYMQNAHSYSVSHALKHEGYSLVYGNEPVKANEV